MHLWNKQKFHTIALYTQLESDILTYLHNIFRHIFVYATLLLLVLYSFETQRPLLLDWFIPLPWIGYLAVTITALIALQFGRSRLFWCCILTAILLLFAQEKIALSSDFTRRLPLMALLMLSYLSCAKDRGFSSHNLILTLVKLTLVGVFSWLMLGHLPAISQNFLSPIYTLANNLEPRLNALYTPFEWLLVTFSVVLCFARFLYVPDHNHGALLLSVVFVAIMPAYAQFELHNVLALTLATSFLYAMLKDSFNMAFKDELTAIPSRRALMQYVNTLGRKYVVVMADIDHFKKFNDSYGHDVGDEVLRLVASRLNKIGGGGKAFRFGGEEFVLIFPRKTPDQALPFVEQIRQLIADYPITLRDKPRPKKAPKRGASKQPQGKTVNITASFGIAKRNSQHSQFSDIMKQADVALYTAKKAGRNCVQLAKQPG
ncbi:GGDEF domain-containing protein [Paraglaciecola polaris]|uniref:diguanylate cyclase n=1 Tax=Paraglaciecola polaris LMG 21857 TaxID=1129793 RepID=K6YGN9_9ALTE|nr:GGDEF domain-containing protein [Paraglaciecola polaris]GAC31894.1 diguanylate cyclase [Paraglaciecola polaris LMG 21857]